MTWNKLLGLCLNPHSPFITTKKSQEPETNVALFVNYSSLKSSNQSINTGDNKKGSSILQWFRTQTMEPNCVWVLILPFLAMWPWTSSIISQWLFSTKAWKQHSYLIKFLWGLSKLVFEKLDRTVPSIKQVLYTYTLHRKTEQIHNTETTSSWGELTQLMNVRLTMNAFSWLLSHILCS